MSSWSQWRQVADKGEVRRVTFVCGDQRVLVEEVVDTVRGLLKATDLDYVSLVAGQDADRTIWAAANQYPLTAGGNRLVQIRNAERIRHWEPLDTWLIASRSLPTSYLLFISNDPDVPHDIVAGKRVTKPFIEAMKTPRGHVVRCGMPNANDAVAWVKRHAPLDDEMARHLLMRTGGNLALAGSVTAKLGLFTNITPGPKLIDELCREVPAESFIDALLALDRRQALLAAQGMDERDFRKTIATLDHRLDTLATLNRFTRTGYAQREVQGVPFYLVRQLWPHAKHYDERTVLYRRQALAVIDAALKNGARDAVLEALVALW